MSTISRSRSRRRRTGLSTEELWKAADRGLIVCWEVGRDLAKVETELAQRARRGELPVLSWKGGVERKIQSGKKYGTLQYLATWQGLRNENLEIEPSGETELTCSRTGVTVIFTGDTSKYA